jgi:hypothetical protein
VRRCLVYVLHNARHHGDVGPGFDPFSSAASFPGWAEALPHVERWMREALEDPVVTARPRTWLLATGWRAVRTGAARGGAGARASRPVAAYSRSCRTTMIAVIRAISARPRTKGDDRQLGRTETIWLVPWTMGRLLAS